MTVKFKGGPIFLNSGGTGPDDVLLKPIEGGRWHLVIFRWGRHFRWSHNGGRVEDLEQAKTNALADREAIKAIYPVRRACINDNAKRYQTMKERGNVPTISADAFWKKYKEVSASILDKEKRNDQ